MIITCVSINSTSNNKIHNNTIKGRARRLAAFGGVGDRKMALNTNTNDKNTNNNDNDNNNDNSHNNNDNNNKNNNDYNDNSDNKNNTNNMVLNRLTKEHVVRDMSSWRNSRGRCRDVTQKLTLGS